MNPLGRVLVTIKSRDLSVPWSIGRLVDEINAADPSISSAIAAALLTLPFLQPIPLMGLSAPFGMVIALAGLAIFLGRPLWLPEVLAKRSIAPSTIHKTADVMSSFEIKLGRWLSSPREFGTFVQRSLGLLIGIHGFLLALPLPIPFSNSMPAWMCFVAALTLIFQSRRLLAASIVLFIGNIAFWTALAMATIWGLPQVKSFFMSL